ncbi:serine/threonine-protein kinase 11-interacting protein isoform X2 [Daktulosphaira vitifoliae]|uniref:serine/threonine-protein kinase 11-interacting protein isoform X2 n=1 Tax=Daktulosphaira vitifoliae TaxID=58002 RepID=UPI0021AA3B11|nr:serine/threonine-protein kinase 11-interacting protein isoform X2 [Daktulosphaira vitifoliae]
MEEVNKIIQQLKHNGEFIVTGHEKLIINTEILSTINTEVLSSLHSNRILNHHYLSEVLKKIHKLKLLQCSNTLNLNQIIDLSPFHSLTHLELIDIDIECLIGLNTTKLDSLIINGHLKTVASFLKRKWPYLQYLVLRGCHLNSLDECLLHTPCLKYLETSRSVLTEIQHIDKLECLECLNLSLNRLTKVPILNDYAARNLSVLVLNYNCINNLTGLSKLTNLKVLDLSNNMIIHHESLSPLGDMSFLRYLNLENNPLAFIENHREKTCGYLHENASVEIFELDNKILSKSEKKFVGQSSRTLDLSFLHYLPQTSAKATKIRSPIIEDGVWNDKSRILSLAEKINYKRDLSKLEHLTTKKQIESVRERFGEDNWLHSHAGSYVQGILGINQQNEREGSIESIRVKNETKEKSQIPIEHSFQENSVYSDTSTNINSELNVSFNEELNEKTIKEEYSSTIIYDNSKSETLWPAQIVNGDNEETSNILLCLSEKDLKEKSCDGGPVITTWSRDSIESCVKINFNPIKIQVNFMTLRRDKNQRVYIMKENDANDFIKIICSELESRTLSEMNQSVFKCVQCTTVFCQENFKNIFNKRKNCCPSCDSFLVVKIEDEPLPSFYNLPEISEVIVPDNENDIDRTPVNSRSSSEEPEQRKFYRNDSDVEIISNPSENSVEILEVTPSLENKNEKILLPINVRQVLTESSSSGSMTDSVCTAYESRKLQKDSLTSCKDIMDSSDSRLTSIFDKPIQFSYDDFSVIDLRLKSYLQQKYFRSTEEFVLIFRCNCIMMNPEYKFDGCIVISNRSLYIFKLTGQSDELLQKISSHRLSLVKSIATLPWNMGLVICVEQPDIDIKYTFVLYIPHITTRLVAFLERMKPFEQRQVLVSSTNTDCYLYVNNMLYTNDLHLPIIYEILCENVTIVSDDGLVEVIELPAIIITEYELVMLGGEFSWLLPYDERCPTIIHVQLMNKLNHIESNKENICLKFEENVSWLLSINRVEIDQSTAEIIKMLSSAKQKLNLSIQTDIVDQKV